MGDPVQDLVPMLKEYLDISNSDREYTRDLIDDLKKTTEAMRECSVTMKLQLRELEVRAQDRDKACLIKHNGIDRKLEQIPSVEMMKKRDEELAEMKTKLDGLLPQLYTAAGILTGSGCMIGLGLAYAFHKFFGGG